MKKYYKLIIPTFFLVFNVCLVLFPQKALASAGEGLQLWFNHVLPSLLPFAIGVNMLTQTGGTNLIAKALSPVMRVLFNVRGAGGIALLTGLTSGYPMGAKTVADLRKAGLVTAGEAQRLAGFCNNAGPLFIVGMAGTGLLGDSAAGYKLLAAHVVSALLTGVLLGLFAPRAERAAPLPRPAAKPTDAGLGVLLGEAIKSAMESMALVGGLIVFFNVVTQLVGGGLTAGLLEVTNGLKNVTAADYLSCRLKLCLAAGFISFGGLSVHAQALSFLSRADIKAAPYLLCKTFHGLLAAGVMFFLTRQW